MKLVIVGASGYSGQELAKLITHHKQLELVGLYVSKESLDQGKTLSQLSPMLHGLSNLVLQPLSDQSFDEINQLADAVCLCTDHHVSVELAPKFLAMNKHVFDLSGGFRLNNAKDYEQYYGFTHQSPQLLAQAVYGLAEWNATDIKDAKLIAVPGCYPTAALNALKPLKNADLLADNKIIVNAISGVSGAGRKANMATQFCEVSLKPYGLFNHRHGPEIEKHLDHKVLFTPHLGNFSRGILETIYVTLKEGVHEKDIAHAFQVLADEPLIRLLGAAMPSINGVANTPYLDIGWHVEGDQLIVISAIDNLLKGASAQALQCINLVNGFAAHTGLVECGHG